MASTGYTYRAIIVTSGNYIEIFYTFEMPSIQIKVFRKAMF